MRAPPSVAGFGGVKLVCGLSLDGPAWSRIKESEMNGDRPVSEFVRLKNGKQAHVCYSWADGLKHVVIRATVLVDTGGGFSTVAGHVQGPVSQDEANSQGITVANVWYDRQNG
ncbi:hypothetical protein [Pseudomonas phage PseuP_222]|nr:hypothetical protein [Pseudomonas phage PseuP_222]